MVPPIVGDGVLRRFVSPHSLWFSGHFLRVSTYFAVVSQSNKFPDVAVSCNTVDSSVVATGRSPGPV